jgi:hypothetical protein
MKQSTSKNSQE